MKNIDKQRGKRKPPGARSPPPPLAHGPGNQTEKGEKAIKRKNRKGKKW
jgi:hypothetical protein